MALGSRGLALASAHAWEGRALEAKSREAGLKDAFSDEDAAFALDFAGDQAVAREPENGWDDDDTMRKSDVPPHIKNEENPL